MSEKELAIINYIIEHFGVTEEQAISTLNDAKKNVPQNQQNEVISYLAESLSSREITTVDGLNEIINTKVEQLRTTELRIQQEAQKKAENEQKVVDAYTRDIENARKAKEEDKANNRKEYRPGIDKLPILTPEERLEVIRDVKQRCAEYANNYPGLKEEILAKPGVQEELNNLAEYLVNETPIDIYTVQNLKSLYIDFKIEDEFIQRALENEGIDIYSVEGLTYASESYVYFALEREQKVLEIEFGDEAKLDTKQEEAIEEARSNGEFDELRQKLFDARERMRHLSKEQDSAKGKPDLVERLTKEQVQTMYDTMVIEGAITMKKMEVLMERGLIDQEFFDKVQEFERIRAEQYYNANRDTLEDNDIKHKEVEEEFNKLKTSLSQHSKVRDSGDWSDQVYNAIEKDRMNLIPYMDKYFARKISVTQGRITDLQEKLKNAPEEEREKIQKDIQSEQKRLEVFEARDIGNAMCCDFIDAYTVDTVGTTIESAISTIEFVNKRLEAEPDNPNYLETKKKIIEEFALTCYSTNALSGRTRTMILDDKRLSKEDRKALVMEVSKVKDIYNLKDRVKAEKAAGGKEDKGPYIDIPGKRKCIDAKYKTIDTLTGAFFDAVEEYKQEKSAEELRDSLLSFKDFISDGSGKVRKFFLGELSSSNKEGQLSRENLEARLEEAGIKPEHRDFYRKIMGRIIDEDMSAKANIYMHNSNELFYHFVTEAIEDVTKETGMKNQEIYSDAISQDENNQSGHEQENVDNDRGELSATHKIFLEYCKQRGLPTEGPRHERFFKNYIRTLPTNVRIGLDSRHAGKTVRIRGDMDPKTKGIRRLGTRPREKAEAVETAETVEKVEEQVGSTKPSKEERKSELLRVASGIKAPEIVEQSTEIRAATQEYIEVEKAKTEDKTDTTPARPNNEGEDREE